MTEPKDSEANKKLESGAEHAKKAIDVAAEAGRTVGDTVKRQAQTVIDAGKEHLGAAAKDVSDAATAKYGEIREQAKHVASGYRAKAENLQGDAENYIRENPLKAVGIALGLGFVLGVLIRR